MNEFVMNRLQLERESRSWRDQPLSRFAGYGLLVAVAYYLGAKLGFALTFQPHPVSTLWPPNAILLASFLLAPTKWWWVLLLAAFPAHLAVELDSGVPIGMVLGWFISNACEALLGAIGIRRYGRDGAGGFDTLHRVVVFIIFGCFVASFVSSFIDSAFVRLIGWGTDTYWQLWRMRTLSNILAALTIVPVIVMTLRGSLAALRRITIRRYVEGFFLATGLVTVCVFAFVLNDVHLGKEPALAYAPLPFVIWAAVRFGPGGVSSSLLVTVLLAIWGAVHGHGPFTGQSPIGTVHSLQGFFLLMAVPLMLLAAVMTERQQTARALRESEERYRGVVETQTELICRYRPDTTLTFVNDAYCRYFGRTREELIGAKFIDFVPAVAREAVKRQVASLIENPREISYEHEVLRPGGEIGCNLWVDSPIRNAEGNVVEFQAAGRDVTQLRRAMEELRQSEERWRLVFDNSAVGILVTDIQGRFFATNAVYERMLGYTKDELRSLTLLEIAHPDDRDIFQGLIGDLLIGRRVQFQIEMRSRRKDGEFIWVSNSISAIHDKCDQPEYLIGVVEDITERRRAEEALNRLNSELELRVSERTTALKAKTQELEAFAYSVAHDLRAPLRGIDGYTRLLIEDYQNEVGSEGRNLLLNVISSAERMNTLIDDLLAYSRIEYGTFRAHTLELRPFVESLVAQKKCELHDDRSEFTLRINAKEMVVDARALGQALGNFLDNAIKFSRSAPAPRIEVGARESDRQWQLWVRDNGIGFDEKYQSHVFEIFRRLHHDEEYEGNGLGLAIARKVIERMGGRVWAESAPGQGSTFVMEIPK